MTPLALLLSFHVAGIQKGGAAFSMEISDKILFLPPPRLVFLFHMAPDRIWVWGLQSPRSREMGKENVGGGTQDIRIMAG